jgi:tetratricopeptide (TPR) repeat protein
MIYMAEKNFELAELELKIQLEKSPSDVAVYLQLGNMHYTLRNMSQATQYFLKGAKIAPDNITLLSKLAQIRTLQKKYDEAIQFYERILALQPDNSITTNNLAILLTNNKADPNSLTRAQRLIEKSKARNHPRLQDTLGWIYYLKGDYDAAISILELVADKAPQYPTFYYHLGMTYMKNGNSTFAKKHLKTSLKLGNFSEREDAMMSLRSLEMMSLELIPK